MVTLAKTWRATRGQVILEIEDQSEKTPAGLELPAGYKDEGKPTYARVLHVGPSHADMGDPGFKVGDRVVTSPGARAVLLQEHPTIVSALFQFVVAVEVE